MVYARFIKCLVSMCLVMGLSTGVLAAETCSNYTNPEVRKVVALVKEAVELVNTQGEAAFKQFSVQGSKWFNENVYVYAHTFDGVLVANGAFPDLVGKNMIDFKDVIGKPVVRLSIEAVSEYGCECGWIHYLWPKPGEVNPSWKSSYVHEAVGPDGTKFFVGAGVYDLPMEKCFAVQMVEGASSLVARQGKKSFPYLRSRTGPFVWKNTYVFVFSLDGVDHVNPAHPELEGVKLQTLQDRSGMKLVDEMLRVTEENGAGWMRYKWPRPGMIPQSDKESYVKRVQSGGMTYFVGCGVYSE